MGPTDLTLRVLRELRVSAATEKALVPIVELLSTLVLHMCYDMF